MSSKSIKNGGILLLGLVFGRGLFQITKDSSLLTASVLDIAEIQQIKAAQRDIAYKKQNQIFEIFGGESLRNSKSLHIQLLYNPETIKLRESTKTGSLSSFQNSSGESLLTLENIKDIPPEQALFSIEFDGDEKDLILGESSMTTLNGQKKPLSVGLLTTSGSDQHQN